MAFAKNRYLLVEIAIRVVLLATFLILEYVQPFQRIIQDEEWWLYKNPVSYNEFCPTKWMLSISVFAPLVVVTITYFSFSGPKRKKLTPAMLAITLSLCLNGVVTNIIKLMVGRPRPDFFFRCFPDGVVPRGQPSALNLQCTGDPDLVTEGRKSFPSGHSSFAFSGLGFCTLYLAGHWQCFSIKGRGSSWRLLVSFLPTLLAIIIAISRTSDYRHHWQDVLIGSVLGFTITYLSYRQHYPGLSHDECDIPYMRNEPNDLSHSRSMDRLQNICVKRDV